MTVVVFPIALWHKNTVHCCLFACICWAFLYYLFTKDCEGAFVHYFPVLLIVLWILFCVKWLPQFSLPYSYFCANFSMGWFINVHSVRSELLLSALHLASFSSSGCFVSSCIEARMRMCSRFLYSSLEVIQRFQVPSKIVSAKTFINAVFIQLMGCAGFFQGVCRVLIPLIHPFLSLSFLLYFTKVFLTELNILSFMFCSFGRLRCWLNASILAERFTCAFKPSHGSASLIAAFPHIALCVKEQMTHNSPLSFLLFVYIFIQSLVVDMTFFKVWRTFLGPCVWVE